MKHAPTKTLHELRLNSIKLVHVARRELSLTEESYRDILARITGKRTAADLDLEGLGKVIAEFQRLGWHPRTRTGHSAGGAGSRLMAADALSRKIRALWLSLWQLGELEDPSEEALAQFVKRTVEVEALQWLDPRQADQVIKALRGWCERVGFKQPDAKTMMDVNHWRSVAALGAVDYAHMARITLIDAQWLRLVRLGAFRYGVHANIATWLRREIEPAELPYRLSDHGSKRAVEKLGEWVRRVKAEAERAAANAEEPPAPAAP